MTNHTYHTYQEILSQPQAWAAALALVEAQRSRLSDLLALESEQALFTGCGSTYYLALAAAALYQGQSGRLARAVPASELLLNPELVLPGAGRAQRTLLVALSRSGSTSETVRAVEYFRRLPHGPVVAITNYGDQPLAGLADLALVIPAGQEESVAQTRSFASMYVAATALCLLAGGRQAHQAVLQALPEAGERLLREVQPQARQLGADLEVEQFFFLGSGERYGLACEASLKMKEMSLTHSEPFHFLEFRHGPMSMVDEQTVVVGLLSERNRAHEQAVLDEMAAHGAKILSLAEGQAQVSFASGLPEPARGVLYLPALQLMAFYRSLAKGLNPDRPHNLSAVVKLDL